MHTPNQSPIPQAPPDYVLVEYMFELPNYNPSLPLHRFATVKLRDKDGKFARPLQRMSI
jgi:hypothetical protein